MSTTPSLAPTPTAARPLERTEPRARVSPRVDVYENASEVLILADVPGATKESLEVHLDKFELTIEARRETAAHGTPVGLEYRSADYHRRFTVPRGIDASKIDAELSAGVLRVRLPKSEALKARKIDIKVS